MTPRPSRPARRRATQRDGAGSIPRAVPPAEVSGPEFLTVRLLTRRSGVGEHTIRRAITSGELPAYYPGLKRRWARVYWPDFVAWMRSKRRPPPTAHAMRVVAAVIAREDARKARRGGGGS